MDLRYSFLARKLAEPNSISAFHSEMFSKSSASSGIEIGFSMKHLRHFALLVAACPLLAQNYTMMINYNRDRLAVLESSYAGISGSTDEHVQVWIFRQEGVPTTHYVSLIYETFEGEFAAYSATCEEGASGIAVCSAPVSAQTVHLMFVDGVMSRPKN